MDRVEYSERKQAGLFGETPSPATGISNDFSEIRDRFIYGEVYAQGSLSDTQRQLITLAVLAAGQTPEEIRLHVKAALNSGASPAEISEALFQCIPYIGFPKTETALREMSKGFQEAGIDLLPESQKQTTEANRFSRGFAVQSRIFGDRIAQMHESAPASQKHIQNYLSAFCFGDIYTRSGLSLQMRELLTFCILNTLGGCESQVRSHINGNIAVGNDKNMLIDALTQCLPYIGFPRTLNALACVNELIPEE